MASSPQIPPVNAGELYLNGLQITMDVAAPLSQIDIARGAARNSTNINDIVLQNDTILFLRRAGLNGLDTGLYASDTLYAIYAIGSSIAVTGNGQTSSIYPAGVLASREFIRPYMPSGYDMFRRIGAILTDSGGDIIPFVQIGNDTRRTMRYGTSFPLLTFGNATTWTIVEPNIAVGYPIMPFLRTNLYLSTTYTTPDLTDSFYFQPTGQPSTAFYFAGDAPVINEAFSQDVVTQTNANSNFNYELDDNAASLSIIFRGYDDLL